MAATTTRGYSARATAPAKSIIKAVPHRSRRISPQAGHALEILGHAIEYLTDELVHEGGSITAHSAQLEAVQLLMALNRQVYFECPQIPTLWERIRALFGHKAVQNGDAPDDGVSVGVDR